LEVLDDGLDVFETGALAEDSARGGPAKLSHLLPLFDVLKVAVEQVPYEVLLNILTNRIRHKIITLYMIILKLLQMVL
jgi:hypothetical protein